MLIRNQLEIPTKGRPCPEELRRYTFTDLTTYLFRIVELFQKYGLGIDRAKNESVAGPGNRWLTCLAYEKPDVRLSVSINSVTVNKELLIVRLGARPVSSTEDCAVSIACFSGTSKWISDATAFTPRPEMRNPFLETVQRFGLFNVDDVKTYGCKSIYIPEKQAITAITKSIEIFKSAPSSA